MCFSCYCVCLVLFVAHIRDISVSAIRLGGSAETAENGSETAEDSLQAAVLLQILS